MAEQLVPLDYTVLFAYFLVVSGVAFVSSLRNRASVSGFFLAGRNMHFLPVGASIFLSNIGAEHVVGLSGGGASSGFAYGNFELHAPFALMLLGWVFVPVYIASGVITMPEYMKKRFGGERIQVYLSVYSLLAYILTKISVGLFAGALFLERAFSWNLYTSVFAILLLSAIFSVLGGLRAVIWTDFAQCLIIVAGSLFLMFKSLARVGGIDGLYAKYMVSRPQVIVANSTCNLPPSDSFHLLQDPFSGTLPWPGVALGVSVIATWYFCTDQVIVQRAISAKSVSHAKAACIVASYGKLLPFFVFVLPGMAARVLFPDTVGCATPAECVRVCGSPTGCSNIAYPTLVMEAMPAGARGLMFAVLLSAVVSSLTSIFNSSSTVFTLDLYRRARPTASELELIVVGRLFVMIIVALSVLWVPIIQASKGSRLFTYIATTQAYIAPPICAAFVLAVLWPRTTESGTFWALVLGLALGLARFAVELLVYPAAAACGDTTSLQPSWIADVHFLYVSAALFLICVVTAVVVSLLTEKIDDASLHRLTFRARHSEAERMELSSTVGTTTQLVSPSDDDLEASICERDAHTGSDTLKKLCCLPENEEEEPMRASNYVSIAERPVKRYLLIANSVVVIVRFRQVEVD